MVYAKFNPTVTNVTTKAVTQWDYGRKLRIDGLELPTAVRIDFGITGSQETVSRIGTTKDHVTDVVIPDSLLEQSSNLVAYVYVNDTQEGKTVRTINIPVTARAKPEEFDTPESKALFTEAIELINDVAVRAEACADSARASLGATERIAEAFTGTAENAVKTVNRTGADCVAAVEAEGASQLHAIAEETAHIVADREQINRNTRNKAPAIILNAEGEVITLTDASDCHLQGLKVFGKSTQDGTPTPDAPVDIVSVENPVVNVDEQTLAFDHTLAGIPVASGGNYTDANGQQWICDEVDFARGVYVQRVNKRILSGAENWVIDSGSGQYIRHCLALSPKGKLSTKGFCSHYPFKYDYNDQSNHFYCGGSLYIFNLLQTTAEFKEYLFVQHSAGTPVSVLYVMETPIETPLSEAEITAFRALHSNKPNTTILNNAGAGMFVEYVADTKTYIDNLLK